MPAPRAILPAAYRRVQTMRKLTLTLWVKIRAMRIALHIALEF